MKLSRIEEQMKMLIGEYATFSTDEMLYEDKLVELGIDVLKLTKLITSVEELFGVVFDKSEVNISMTVQAFVDLVESRVEG
jgi:acyl carrier protein